MAENDVVNHSLTEDERMVVDLVGRAFGAYPEGGMVHLVVTQKGGQRVGHQIPEYLFAALGDLTRILGRSGSASISEDTTPSPVEPTAT